MLDDKLFEEIARENCIGCYELVNGTDEPRGGDVINPGGSYTMPKSIALIALSQISSKGRETALEAYKACEGCDYSSPKIDRIYSEESPTDEKPYGGCGGGCGRARVEPLDS